MKSWKIWTAAIAVWVAMALVVWWMAERRVSMAVTAGSEAIDDHNMDCPH